MSPLDAIRSEIPQANTTHDKVDETREVLKTRILTLNECAWENRIKWTTVETWLNNFDGSSGVSDDLEKIHALFLLSRFLYFGSLEIRVLLRALYRDLVYLPLLQTVTAQLSKPTDQDILDGIRRELMFTRFLGVGTPSESGVHLLYFFRQENGLSKEHFLDQAQLLAPTPLGAARRYSLRYPQLKRLVFVDDVCGSGETAVRYSEGSILTEVLSLKADIELAYYSLFATTVGLKRVREDSCFADNTDAVFELNNTYRCLSDDSRYITVMKEPITQDILTKVARHYGELLTGNPLHALGYEDSQLLFGFHHNTPDNTLPIIWAERENGAKVNWTPIFRRYPKIVGMGL